MPVSLVRHVLVPLVPASLIAAPLASLAAGVFGSSWGLGFALIATPIALLWGVFSYREDRDSAPVATCTDPLFGELVRYRSGDWETQLDFAPTGGRLVLQIEADEAGPSEDQRQRFHDFVDSFDSLVPALSSAVGGDEPDPDVTVWGALLPQDVIQDGEVVAACSVARPGRAGVSWYVTLQNGQVVRSAQAEAA